MKILSRYILKEHLGPFLFAFITVTFFLIIDYVPRIVDSVIDKDLELIVVLELIALNLAWMVALSVPMSVLVATLMAFGRLTSDFEITAIKASGVNIVRVLIPLLIAAALIAIGMIEFNDRILPDLNKKARTLRADISAMRPTLIFRSGIFISDIPGYLILIDKVDHATSRVESIRITDTRNPAEPRIIVAESGFLKTIDNGQTMQFTLFNGEIHSLDTKEPDNYRRIDFKKQVINITGLSSELNRTDSEYRTDREMNILQMQSKVDQVMIALEPMERRLMVGLMGHLDYLFSDTFSNRNDSAVSDSAAYTQIGVDARTVMNQVKRIGRQIKAQTNMMNKYQIEIYKKYSIPVASLAFILIGAPLGIMSRRKGMGMAIAFSIVIFVIYWAFLIGGEDLADRGMISPFWAMWSANILMGIIGVYLLYIIATEKQILGFLRRRQ